jgi:hypothetical protein
MLDTAKPVPRGFAQVADALITLAEALRGLDSEAELEHDDAVERLWERLGLETQRFLYEVAADFGPADPPFDLETVAARLGIARDSARARLMAIGRSARAMGMHAPRLWESERDPETRRRRYVWDPAAHETVMRLVEG